MSTAESIRADRILLISDAFLSSVLNTTNVRNCFWSSEEQKSFELRIRVSSLRISSGDGADPGLVRIAWEVHDCEPTSSYIYGLVASACFENLSVA